MITTWRGDTRERGWRETAVDGIRVHWLSLRYSNRLGYFDRMLRFVAFAARASKEACRIKGDVVLATSTPLTIAIPGIYCSRRHRVPLVFEVRDLWPEIPIKLRVLRNPFLIWAARWLEKAAYRNAEQVIALSPDMAEKIAAVRPEASVTVIPNFCDTEFFGRTQSPDARVQTLMPGPPVPTILYAGTLGYVNNVRYLVEIARVADARNYAIKFLVVGAGREEAEVRRLAREHGVLGKNFFMAPPMPKERMGSLFASVDVSTSFVLDEPALWANSANKVFDALAAGKPVAINHGGWLAKAITESGAGIVLPAGHPEPAAEMFDALVHDPRRLQGMSVAALTLARSRFAADRLADQFEQVLAKAVIQFRERQSRKP